ncbi:MAG: glutamine--tRNA ligase, partial [Draconibacterium sp.]|nr:glutamine--tRNA ligase [Draconibacterium sp.]
SAKHAIEAEVRLYDHLFTKRDPNETDENEDYKTNLNPDSLKVIKNAYLEPALKGASSGERYQFERLGYFCLDPVDSAPGKPVFNRTVALRDSWAKARKK